MKTAAYLETLHFYTAEKICGGGRAAFLQTPWGSASGVYGLETKGTGREDLVSQ
jgi:hypothetical protein